MKFTVIKNSDILKYVPPFMRGGLEDILIEIEEGRKKAGKDINQKYAIINLDEPYAKDVIKIMKEHGHWEEN